MATTTTYTQISDVTVILLPDYAEDLAGAVKMLEAVGLVVESADDDNSVVEGSIESNKLAALYACKCVSYVRVEMTYLADHPMTAASYTGL